MTNDQAVLQILTAGCMRTAIQAEHHTVFSAYNEAAAAGNTDEKVIESYEKQLEKIVKSVAAAITEEPVLIRSRTHSLISALDALAPSPQSASDLAKQVFKSLFTRDTSLQLSAGTAEPFFGFVRDILVASNRSGLPANRILANTVTTEEVRQAGSFLAATAGALNTHDAKSAHSSAKMQLMLPSAKAPSRFFNSSALASELGARSSGGPLKPAPWLEKLFRFRVTVGYRTFALIDAVCDPTIRNHMRANGIDAFAELPAITPASGGYDPTLVGQTRINTGEASISLNLVPSNAMLKATRLLGQKIAENTAMRMAELHRKSVLGIIPETLRNGISVQLPVELFVPAAQDFSEQARLIKAINAVLKPSKIDMVDGSIFRRVWDATEPHTLRSDWDLVRVPTVGSHAQNCGSAYLNYAGKGIYRFPAAPPLKLKNSLQSRKFHVANKRFAELLSAEVQTLQSQSSLDEKYMAGEKWLPRRVQLQRQLAHVDRASKTFVRLLRRMLREITLTADERLQVWRPDLSPIQCFIMNNGVVDFEHAKTLAEQGVALLRSADVAVHSLFIEATLTHLKADAS